MSDSGHIATSQPALIKLMKELEGWKELSSKMREIWVRRVHDLQPPLTDEEIMWADEYIAATSKRKRHG